ncbi:hypothetical protein SALBM217S_05304 [Streptomyces griseoloalbus]
MPNWPMKSPRCSAIPSARLLLRPMVARKVCTSASVRPTPSSSTRTTERSAYSRMPNDPAGAAGSRACRAVSASTAFCISSRR